MVPIWHFLMMIVFRKPLFQSAAVCGLSPFGRMTVTKRPMTCCTGRESAAGLSEGSELPRLPGGRRMFDGGDAGRNTAA